MLRAGAHAQVDAPPWAIHSAHLLLLHGCAGPYPLGGRWEAWRLGDRWNRLPLFADSLRECGIWSVVQMYGCIQMWEFFHVGEKKLVGGSCGEMWWGSNGETCEIPACEMVAVGRCVHGLGIVVSNGRMRIGSFPMTSAGQV